MTMLHVSAEQDVQAPADLVYQCIANYRTHHPHIVPAAMSDMQVEAGGIGAGTVLGFNVTLFGRTQAMRQEVSEPEPGRVLMESTIGRDQVTTFTVTPEGARSHVRIETIWQPVTGLAGVAERLILPRTLRKLYAEELEILNRYAQSQIATSTTGG